MVRNHFDTRLRCCGTLYWMNLDQQSILTDSNLLFPTGMAKTVNMQLVRLDCNVLIPQPVQPHTKVFCGFCCVNILLSYQLLCYCLLRSYLSMFLLGLYLCVSLF